MKIETLKDLEKLIALCQKKGVRAIKIDGIEMDIPLKAPPTKRYRSNPEAMNYLDPGKIEIPDIKTPDELSPEQLLFFSSANLGDTQ